MNRAQKAQKIGAAAEQFFEDYPEIEKTLRLFDLTYEQYQRATEYTYSYTDVSTSGSAGRSEQRHKVNPSQ